MSFPLSITVETGGFELLKRAIGRRHHPIAGSAVADRILIRRPFSKGASGFGTRSGITGAVLIGLGFSPLAASGFADSPIPHRRLRRSGTDPGPCSVSGSILISSGMVGRQLPVLSLIVPFGVVWGVRLLEGHEDVWPASWSRVTVRNPHSVSRTTSTLIVDIGAS